MLLDYFLAALGVAKGGVVLTEKIVATVWLSAANTKASLLNELFSQGVKYTPENIVQVTKTSDGKVTFLESDNNKSGLQYIINEHAKDFANIGVSEVQTPNVVMKADEEGKVFVYQ